MLCRRPICAGCASDDSGTGETGSRCRFLALETLSS